MKHTLPPDEAILFRDAVRDVRPRPTVASPSQAIKPKTAVRQPRSAQMPPSQTHPVAEPTLLSSGDELSFRRDHVTHQCLKRLRRGDYAAVVALDLHGLTVSEATTALTEFINEAIQHEYRCVRIIHGKGQRSGERGPVLKNTVNAWLRQCEVVAAFSSARPADGGSGAVFVLLQLH
ncbi:MAG: Smr/MutS family protein [Steroidobacteraceae bacterium]